MALHEPPAMALKSVTMTFTLFFTRAMRFRLCACLVRDSVWQPSFVTVVVALLSAWVPGVHCAMRDVCALDSLESLGVRGLLVVSQHFSTVSRVC